MLTLESPIYEIEGILVYRDHAIPTQFYYAAPPPRIARANGRLMFDILGYSVDLKQSVLSGTQIPSELGAGFLTMGAECVLTDGQRSSVVGKLAELSGAPEARIALYPIPYSKGTVSVLALDQYTQPGQPQADPASATPLQGRPTFVEKILGSGKPSLLGDLRTIFSLSLSQDGLTFMQGLFGDNAAPVGVVYDLSFFGLRPAVDIRITADLTRIFRHFGGGLGVQYQWIKAEVSAALDYLREQGAIKIEITSQATGDAAQKATELGMSLFKDQIVQQMFRPTTPSAASVPSVATAPAGTGATAAGAAGAGGKGGDKGSSAIVTLRADFKLTEESKSVVYDFSQRAPEERTHAPQGFLPALMSPAELQQHIHMIDLSNPFFEALEVLVSGPSKQEFEALGIRQVTAVLTYGQPGDAVPPESQTLLFRPDSTGDKPFAVKRRGRNSLAYTAALTYDFTAAPGSSADSVHYELSPVSHTGRSLLITPYADFGVLDVEVEAGNIHPDVRQVDIDLIYADADAKFRAEQKFRILPGNPQDVAARRHWQVRMRDTDVRPYAAAFALTFQDGSAYQAPARSLTDALLRVDTPFVRDRELLVRPNPASPDINEILVELDYQDRAHAYERKLLINLTPPFASVRQTWPILDVNLQKVRYRVTVQEPGMSSEGDWQETDDPSIIVGAVAHRVAKVGIQLIGPPLGDVGLDALQIKIALVLPDAPEADPQSVLLQPGQSAATVELNLPPGATLRYRWQTTAFKSSGQVVESDWTEATTAPLIISTRKL
jgi:hypothetical protein